MQFWIYPGATELMTWFLKWDLSPVTVTTEFHLGDTNAEGWAFEEVTHPTLTQS